MPKLGKLSPKMEELLLSLVKEEGMAIRDEPKKKPGRPAKKKADTPLASRSVQITGTKELSPKYTKSTLWVIERAYKDAEGFLRWEHIAAFTDDAVDYHLKAVGKNCRKRQVIVLGQNHTKEEVDEHIKQEEQKQPEFKFDEKPSDFARPVNGGEG